MELDELKKLQKEEAIKRLEILQKVYKLHPNVLKEFKQEEKIYYSERINEFQNGILYWLDNRTEFVEAVKNIQNKYNIYVFHAILNHYEFGDYLSILYVSNELEEWEKEKSELIEGLPFVYVYDFSGYCSEFGTIQIEGANGGLSRIN